MILEDFLPRGTENPPSWFWDEKRRFWNRLGQLLHGSSDLTWVWMRFLRGFDIEKDKTAPLRSYKYKGHGQLMLPMHNRQKKSINYLYLPSFPIYLFSRSSSLLHGRWIDSDDTLEWPGQWGQHIAATRLRVPLGRQRFQVSSMHGASRGARGSSSLPPLPPLPR